MITIIHGEDTAASRNYYFELKKQFPGAATVQGSSTTQTDLQQSLSGGDLFGTIPHIFIDELVSKRKSPKEIESLTKIINASQGDVTMWESKELTSKQIAGFKGATVKLFKIPSTIFAFLDAIQPTNGKQLIELFHKTLEDKDPEFVLFMLTRLVRTLLALCSRHSEQSEESQSISEISRLAPWQKGKVEKQAKLFSIDQLLKIHNKLFQLELHMKTGGLTLPLADSIDLLLLEL